ncbi:MAG: hypothetical protein P4M11_07180 [Candidatus Pacebacteria bacterium]|nr:hypothetical protein [Candidatus Paceibacterota bacterium]
MANQMTEGMAALYLRGILEACSKYELDPNVVDHLSLALVPLLTPGEGGSPAYICTHWCHYWGSQAYRGSCSASQRLI